ncbi:hydrolase [Streptomyces sp. 150FB]|uniref:alpha/beta fold hydrolase n=1 Tax=Streptomyces sp. 150FB TaxID=1576605 RepID=UPI0005890D79|nr:alpha/beta fold hydrolase [Streptomyces sp. 150FB]KIF78276.1 hydrolase [Streptomyces sp. 150FB]
MLIFDHQGNPLQSARAAVNGTQLHYRMGGSGEPVVLLHGVPKTGYHWRHIVPLLTRNYTVVVPDLRGLGDSFPAEEGYDTVTLSEDIAQLMDSLGHREYRVVGEDWGAATAYQLAARYPDRVRQLVYQEALLAGFGWEDTTRLTRSNVSQGSFVFHLGFFFKPDVPELLISGHEREFITWWLKNEAYNVDALTTEALDEYVRCYSSPGSLRAMLSIYRASLDDADSNHLAAQTPLGIPVLAVGGEFAIGADTERQMREVARDVRGIVLATGHQVAEEAPAETAAAYLEFFRTLPSS